MLGDITSREPLATVSPSRGVALTVPQGGPAPEVLRQRWTQGVREPQLAGTEARRYYQDLLGFTRLRLEYYWNLLGFTSNLAGDLLVIY